MNRTIQRDGYFDTLKFVLMLFVIYGHAIVFGLKNSDLIKGIYIFIYTFHMPLFIFVSGYFSKNVQKSKTNKFALRFIETYIVCQIAWLLYLFIFSWHLKIPETEVLLSTIKRYILYPFGYLWYIISLISWKYLILFFKDINKTLLFILAAIASLLIGFIDYNGEVMSISRTISFFPFFLLGYYTTNENIMSIRKGKNKLYLLIPIVVLLISFSSFCLDYPKIEELSYGKYPFSYFETPDSLDFVIRVCFIIAAFLMSYVLMKFCKANKWFSLLGEKSLLFYIYHLYILFILRFIFNHFGLGNNIYYLSIQAIIATTMLVVISRYKFFETILNPISYFLNRRKID